MCRPPPRSPLFPYTTLFRSGVSPPLSPALYRRSVGAGDLSRSEEHTSELQSLRHLVCRLLLEKKSMSSSEGCSTPVLDSHWAYRSRFFGVIVALLFKAFPFLQRREIVLTCQ